MMGEIAKLTAGSNGALDEADYQRTVDTLLAGGDLESAGRGLDVGDHGSGAELRLGVW